MIMVLNNETQIFIKMKGNLIVHVYRKNVNLIKINIYHISNNNFKVDLF